MKNAVNARGFILEFLSTSCAITHEISNNGTGLSNFYKITCTSQLIRHSFFSIWKSAKRRSSPTPALFG